MRQLTFAAAMAVAIAWLESHGVAIIDGIMLVGGLSLCAYRAGAAAEKEL